MLWQVDQTFPQLIHSYASHEEIPDHEDNIEGRLKNQQSKFLKPDRKESKR